MLGAVNGQNNLLFFTFGLAVAGLLISGMLSGAALMGIEVQRLEADPGAVGEELTLRYRVHNRNRYFGAFAVTIHEQDSKLLPLAPFMATPTAFVAYVPPRGEVIAECRVRPAVRGQFALSRMRAWTTFPFGLTKKSVTFEQAGSVLVRPRPAPIAAEPLRQSLGRGESGSHLRRDRAGDEFHSLREFQPGDSPRNIAWKTTARLGRAVVREMAVLPAQRVWIVLDLASLPPDKAERAISVAAGLMSKGIELGFEPGLGLAGPGGMISSILAPSKGRRQLGTAFDALARLTPHHQAIAADTGRQMRARSVQPTPTLTPTPVSPVRLQPSDAIIAVTTGQPVPGALAINPDDPSHFTQADWSPRDQRTQHRHTWTARIIKWVPFLSGVLR